MYKKIYGTSSAELSTIINVGGIPRRIEFTGGVPSGVSRDLRDLELLTNGCKMQ